MTTVTGIPIAAGLLGVSGQFYLQSAFWGGLAEVADIASGNYSKTIGQRLQGALIDQFGRRLRVNEKAQDRIKDAINDASRSSRCR